jgi:predicted nucleotidyltransferase component of viral defense system
MLYTRTVEPRTFELLRNLMSLDILKDFYLVGGTALALQKGHRFSVDLDLFTTKLFDVSELKEALVNQFDDFVLTNESGQMMFALINNVKVDFVKMGYPTLFNPTIEDGVRMLDIKDIAPMKLKAIVQRGSKKDFFDLFYILQELKLIEVLDLYKKKFNQSEVFHVLKSLSYFEDAENDFDPILFDKNITWGHIKDTIKKEIYKFSVA